MLGEDCYVPPLLRPLARRGIDEVEAIAEALFLRQAKPIPARPPEHGRLERVLISLRSDGGAGVRVELRIGAQVHGEAVLSALPKGLAAAQAAFLKGFRHGLRRDVAELVDARHSKCRSHKECRFDSDRPHHREKWGDQHVTRHHA
jgi:hypothetical protein